MEGSNIAPAAVTIRDKETMVISCFGLSPGKVYFFHYVPDFGIWKSMPRVAN